MSVAVDTVMEIYQNYGSSDYIGEEITQTEHALQCAAEAERRGETPAFIAGALLHDIGHLVQDADNMGTHGKESHELVGAEFLSDLGFSDFTVSLVRNHVNGKRYLAKKNPAVLCHMSEASLKTLFKYQGGAMSDEEAAEFEREPYFQEHLRLRAIDDNGKDPEHPVTKTFEDYRGLLLSVMA